MKRSQIDRAVESLTAKVVVLQLAIDALREQQAVKVARPRKPKAVEPVRKLAAPSSSIS